MMKAVLDLALQRVLPLLALVLCFVGLGLACLEGSFRPEPESRQEAGVSPGGSAEPHREELRESLRPAATAGFRRWGLAGAIH